MATTRTLTPLSEGGALLRVPALARRPLVGLGLLPPRGLHLRRRRARGAGARGRGPAVRPRLAARRRSAGRLDEGPPGAATLGRRRPSPCTPTSRSSRAATSTTWSSTREGRAYAGNFGFDLMGGGDPAPAGLVRDRPRRERDASLAEDLLVPQRHGHHRRRHADRRRDLRRPLHGVHDPARRGAGRSARLGRRSSRRPSPPTRRRCSARSPSGPTAARSTPRSTSGPPTRSAARSAASPRAADRRGDRDARGPRRLRLRARRRGRAHARGLRGSRLRRARRGQAAREAVLLTTTVDVPHAGLP